MIGNLPGLSLLFPAPWHQRFPFSGTSPRPMKTISSKSPCATNPNGGPSTNTPPSGHAQSYSPRSFAPGRITFTTTATPSSSRNRTLSPSRTSSPLSYRNEHSLSSSVLFVIAFSNGLFLPLFPPLP